ncbi:hypothetical protein M9H77_23344 [Catharanthus roseus]|uniref:Uncharacterized protein n=1 Tax=Catharanthus roseus TaxID=4058 RepID=A0ACC0AX33_CATRO|nr:hypothetical protein M9H77_23344 [Catharanthus roseus]
MENEGKIDYYFYEIISFPPPPSYSCFGHFCKEATSCSYVFDLDRNSLQHACTITSMNKRRHPMEFEGQSESIGGKLIEDQRKSGGKGVLLSPTNSSIIFLTNSSPTYLEFYSKELKLFLNSYAFH